MKVCRNEAQYLRPDRDVYGFDARSAPSRFESYLDWLFDFEYGADGTVVEGDDTRALRTATGAEYVVIGAGRRAVGGLRDFLAGLDELGASVAIWSDRPFARWYDETAGARPRERVDAAE